VSRLRGVSRQLRLRHFDRAERIPVDKSAEVLGGGGHRRQGCRRIVSNARRLSVAVDTIRGRQNAAVESIAGLDEDAALGKPQASWGGQVPSADLVERPASYPSPRTATLPWHDQPSPAQSAAGLPVLLRWSWIHHRVKQRHNVGADLGRKGVTTADRRPLLSSGFSTPNVAIGLHSGRLDHAALQCLAEYIDLAPSQCRRRRCARCLPGRY